MKVVLEAQLAMVKVHTGIPVYAVQLIKSLLARGANQYALSFFDENRERGNRQVIEQYFGEYGVPYHECNSFSYKKTYQSGAYAQTSYNEYTGADGDVFHFLHISPVPDNLSGKMVVTIHDMLPLKVPEYFPPIEDTFFHEAIRRMKKTRPTLIADSEATKADVVDIIGASPDRVFVAPLAYDASACFPQENAAALKQMGVSQPYILFLGSMDRRKNIIRLIEAFEQLAARDNEISLVLAGGKFYGDEAIIEKAKGSPFAGRIIMTGYITDEQKRALLSGALFFAFPSLYEGFGLPVLEAMACGCPVLTSNTSSLPEVAGDAAILVDPRDTEQLAFEMQRLMYDEALRAQMKKQSLARAREFSWDKTAQATERVYEAAFQSL